MSLPDNGQDVHTRTSSTPHLGVAIDQGVNLAEELADIAQSTDDHRLAHRLAKAATSAVTLTGFLHDLAELLATVAGVPETGS
jgi:hypothetical protein